MLLWSGHAVRSDADELAAAGAGQRQSVPIGLGGSSDVAAPCAESGASQLLFIVDTCFSGEAVSAGEVAARIMQRPRPKGSTCGWGC